MRAFLQTPTILPGETLKGRLWIVNDTYEAYDGTLQWRVTNRSGNVLVEGSVKAQIAEDCADTFAAIGEALPNEEGLYRMDILYSGAKGELASNFFDFEVAGQ